MNPEDALINDALVRQREERQAELNQLSQQFNANGQFQQKVNFLHKLITEGQSSAAGPSNSFCRNEPHESHAKVDISTNDANSTTTVVHDDDDSDDATAPACSERVVEIQTLVSRRLVSSVLHHRSDDGVRATLERILAPCVNLAGNGNQSSTPVSTTEAPPTPSVASNIVSSSGPDLGEELRGLRLHRTVHRVLESQFPQTLTNIILNHLNLLNNDLQENLHVDDDSISVISTTTSVSNGNGQKFKQLCRQVKSMQTEIQQFKTMINLLMDAQKETQRLMSHEIAPRLSRTALVPNEHLLAQFKDAELATAPNNETASIQHIRGSCLICLTNPATMMVYRCGHLCMCYACSLSLRRTQQPSQSTMRQDGRDPLSCPVCRTEVLDIVRVYSDQFQASSSSGDF